MWLSIYTFQVVCQTNLPFPNYFTLNFSNGQCTSVEIDGNRQYSDYTYGPVCRPGFLNTTQGCVQTANTPASNLYVAAANTIGQPAFPSEIDCSGDFSLAFSGNDSICGYPVKVAHPKYSFPSVGRCPATTTYAPAFGQCVTDQNSANIYTQAQELCEQGSPRACFYISNNNSRLLVLGQQPEFDSGYFATANPPEITGVNSKFVTYKSYADSPELPAQPGQPAQRQVPRYTNIVDMQFVISDANGTLIAKSSLFSPNFDICAFAKFGTDPGIQYFGSRDEQTASDSRIYRNSTYYNVEMLRRSFLGGITVSPPRFYHSMFGNNVVRKCRLGTQQVVDMPELYLAIYSATQHTDADGTQQSLNVQLPAVFGENLLYTIPLKAMTKPLAGETTIQGTSRLRVLTQLSLQFTETSTGIRPSASVQYSDLSPTPGLSTLRTQDQSSYGYTNMSNFVTAHQTAFLDFTFRSTFSAPDNYTLLFHIIYALCVVLCAGWHVICRVITARHVHQGLNRSSTGAAARLDSIYPLLVGLVKSLVLGSLAFCGIVGYCALFPGANLHARGYFQTNQTGIYAVIVVFTFILLIARIAYMVKRPLKLFVLDHGGTGIGAESPETTAWRRIFACNALFKVLQAESVPLEAVLIVFSLISMVLGLQSFNTGAVATQLTTYFTASGALYPTFCALLLTTHFFCAIIFRVFHFFTGKNEIERLGDLLPLLDCSVIIFDGFGGAHLIYGRSFFGAAQRSPQELCKVLKREAKGLYQRRGLKHGSGVTFYRVFFNQRVDYLKDLRAGISLLRPRIEPQGDFGAAPVPGPSTFGLSGISAQLPPVGPAQFDVFRDLSSCAELLTQRLADEPHFHGLRLNSVVDAPPRLPRTLDVAVVADGREGFSVNAVDDGHRLPGGFGAAPWVTKALQRHRHLWNVVIIAGLSSFGGFLGNIGIAFTIAAAAVWMLREIDRLYERKTYGNYMFVCDAML